MTQVMKGVRILEVAQFTFVPAAGAVLADWGADVIKIVPAKHADPLAGNPVVGLPDVEVGVGFLWEITNRGKRCIAVDVSTEDGTEAWMHAALSAFGRVDLLHANAGVEGPLAAVPDYPIADFDRIMLVNVRGVFLGVRAVMHHQRAVSAGGSIVITSSVAGLMGSPLFPAYAFIVIERQWHSARWSIGVTALIMDGVAPAKVPDQVIDEIRTREVRGAVELPQAPGMQVGDRVRVLGGPFAGLTGLYAGMKPHARVEVLLALFGSRRNVTLPRGGIELVPDAGEQ